MGVISLPAKLQGFMEAEKLATIAVPIDEHGSIHIAILHGMACFDPLRVYFVTNISSEKCTLLRTKQNVTAACCIGGISEAKDMYVQMRGVINTWRFEDKPHVAELYFAWRHDPSRSKEGGNSVLLEFVPTYLKYIDFSKGWQSHIVEL